jgi:hypothetical protein
MATRAKLWRDVVRWSLNRISSRDAGGSVRMPGYGKAIRIVDSDESELLVVLRGDAVDVYTGNREFVHFALSREVVIKFAIWTLRWWVIDQWCGLRMWLWYRLIGSLVASTHEAKPPRDLPRERDRSDG